MSFSTLDIVNGHLVLAFLLVLVASFLFFMAQNREATVSVTLPNNEVSIIQNPSRFKCKIN